MCFVKFDFVRNQTIFPKFEIKGNSQNISLKVKKVRLYPNSLLITFFKPNHLLYCNLLLKGGGNFVFKITQPLTL